MKHRPFVPETIQMKELTLRAVVIGLVMTVILGAANAYLGLHAGQTIAATYPAAVIGMAVLRAFKGSVLEENIARTAGTIGEGVAAGVIFTIPAFLMSGSWTAFDPAHAYWRTTALTLTGSVLGVLFVSLVRRALVEDPTLPFPESVAASEIHKAGQRGADAARYLFWSIGLGTLIQALGELSLYAVDKDFLVRVGQAGRSFLRLGSPDSQNILHTGAISTVAAPTVSPALIGVGFVIGPELSALNFSGSVLAWGVLVPLMMYFLGPNLQAFLPAGAGDAGWAGMAAAVWRYIVRPIAVGGMMVGAAYTLFKMGRNLTSSLGRAIAEVRHGRPPLESMARTERYMSSKVVLSLIFFVFLAMIALYFYISGLAMASLVAALVMLIVGFFFATVSGNLCGVIGSSNNPVSGLTLSTLIIAALLMVALGVSGPGGVAVVLGVAAVVCVSSSVAGELMQDFKAGYILGGTPRSIQIVELIAVVISSLVMYFPLYILQQGNLKSGGSGFGDPHLAAPQAGLMAALAQGIVGGEMAWPLVVCGALFGVMLIMINVKSPMLVAIGMYLPFQTTAAIFVGGILRWMVDAISRRRGNNEAQKTRVENVGILMASGLIAGEALTGLLFAYFKFKDIAVWQLVKNPSYAAGFVVLLILSAILIFLPLSKAGRPEDPAPPAAMM
ncbi:MAG TPA: oligopeptide transporter, OPT family [Bryobacteraceae bacterium]|jgi:putative OPT family oligopeptide transporter|nr:oligopeptide transporter, OPT family [Bryobacteraceae bacterium]